jgi:serine/threonine protein kinase
MTTDFKSAVKNDLLVLSPIGKDPRDLIHNWSNTVDDEIIFHAIVAKGGFGPIWFVSIKDSKRQRMCKIIDKRGCNRKTLQSFHDEIKILQTLKGHPNIIKVYKGYETRNKLYQILEILSGGNVYNYFLLTKNGQFSESDCKHIVKQILEALNYVHEKGIIHCDVQPVNIHLPVKDSNSIKLIDFCTRTKKHRQEWMKKVRCSLNYIAPECLDENFTQKMDIWSVGVIAFEILHGYLPFSKRIENLSNPQIEKLENTKAGIGNWINSDFNLSHESHGFLTSILKMNPDERPSAKECLSYDWIKNFKREEILDHVKPGLAQRNNHAQFIKFLKLIIRNDETSLFTANNVKQICSKYDSENNDGKLNLKEFKKLIVDLHPRAKKDFINHCFEMCKMDNEYKISIDEFFTEFAFFRACQHDDHMWNFIEKIKVQSDGDLSFGTFDRFNIENSELLNHISPKMKLQIKELFETEESITFAALIHTIAK